MKRWIKQLLCGLRGHGGMGVLSSRVMVCKKCGKCFEIK